MHMYHPRIAKRWEKETPRGRKLPYHVRNPLDADDWLRIVIGVTLVGAIGLFVYQKQEGLLPEPAEPSPGSGTGGGT
jgi:hypothetical protein